MEKHAQPVRAAEDPPPGGTPLHSDFVLRDGVRAPRFGPKPTYRSLFAMWMQAPSAAVRWLLHGGDEPDHFLGPVRWLFGRELVVYLRSIALYSAFGEELDHRDWMRPELIDLSREPCEEGAFWFDYVSDTGDSQLVMYNIASLLLSDLYLDESDQADKPQRIRFDGGATRLPRGRFAFFGGDTAYHVADVPTLERRVCAPVTWAYREWLRRVGPEQRRDQRHVFAIPGNHDYYDSLIGFNKLFRGPDNARVPLADFHRTQHASYVALQLPFDFVFLGLDSQHGRMDLRQQSFFRGVLAERGMRRLIVATPEPPVVFDVVHPQWVEPFKALQLPRPFADGRYPPADMLHLDMAGDVHHYARYTDDRVPNYGQLVAGGGAFLHPTQTSWAPPSPAAEGPTQAPATTAVATAAEPPEPPTWPPRAAKLYPSIADSRQATAARLLCPWIILRGGGAFLLGALSAATAYLGLALGPGMHRVFVDVVVPKLAQLSRHVADWGAPLSLQTPVLLGLESVVEASGIDVGERTQLAGTEWGAVGVILFLIVFVYLSSRRLFARASALDESHREAVPPRRYALMCVATVVSFAALGFLHYGRVLRDGLPLAPFLSSFLLLAYLAPLPLSVLWVVKYLATIPKQAKVRRIEGSDSIPRYLALSFGIGSASLGLLGYGSNSVAAFALDLGAMTALSFSFLLPIGLGLSQGAQRSFRFRLLYAALGLCFGVFQVALPLSLSLWARPAGAAAILLTALSLELLTLWLFRRWPNRYLLLVAFLATGSICLALSVSNLRLSPVDGQSFVVALIAGGLFTCIWLGFYLAVALSFGAHNNEAGGAARLDGFRHFVRIKVEADRITGYVIGFERPEVEVVDGDDAARVLQARLVDRFELHAQPRGGRRS